MTQALPLPDGSFVRIRPGETPEQTWARAQREYPEAFNPPPQREAQGFTMPRREVPETPDAGPRRGIIPAAIGGGKRFLSMGRTGIESLFDAEGAAARGVERGDEISEQYAPGADWGRVSEAYRERGLLPAAGEVLSQVPRAVAEQLPQIGATFAGARAGALAGAKFGPKGALIGGIGGAVAPSLLQLYGGNLERQAEVQQEAGEELNINRAAAFGAAVPGASLEAAATLIPFGRAAVAKILGPDAAKALAVRGSREIAEESLKRTLLQGAAVGTALEVPTEVTQQMLERLQAGLDLTSDEALAEYGHAAYGAALVGSPLGAAGRAYQRSAARGEREEEQRQQAAERQAAEAQRLQSPEYLDELEANYNALRQEVSQLSNITRPKRPKDATPEQEIAYEDELAAFEQAKQQREEALARFRPVRDEYKAVLPRIEQRRAQRAQEDARRQQAIETEAARDQPTATDLARAPGEQTVLPGFAEPEPVQQPVEEADIESPYARRARLEREVRGIEDVRNQLREEGMQTTDVDALRRLAERDRELQEAQLRAQREIDATPAVETGPTIKSLDDRIKRLQKQLQNAQEAGDLQKAATAAENLRTAQQERAEASEQRGFADGQFRDAGGVSETTDAFNQRVVGPEIADAREARAAQEALRQATVTPEVEALQRIAQREEATPAIRQARDELGLRREMETMGRQAAMDRQRTRQSDLFTGETLEVRTPSRTTPEALDRLIARAQTSPNISEQDRMLLQQVTDNLPAMRQSPDRAQLDTVADWLYRSAVGQPSAERRADVQALVNRHEQGRLSETDRQTEAQQRAMTKEEKRALQGLTPGTVPGPVTNMTNRRGVMERAPTGPEMRAAQQELPGVEPTAMAFRDFREFEDYLASSALAQIRAAAGLEGDTVALQARNLAELERTMNSVRAQIAEVERRREAARVAPEAESREASALLQEAQAELLELQRKLDAEMIGAQVRYLEAAQNAARGQQAVADVAQQVSDNMALLEQQIAQYEQQVGARDQRTQMLRAAQAELKSLVDVQAADKQAMADALNNIASGLPFDTHSRAYNEARLRVLNRRSELVGAHQKLMQANAAIPAMPKLSSTVFRDFLLRDAELQTQLVATQRRLGGLNTAKVRAKTALDNTFRAQQADPAVIKALNDARSDVEVAAQRAEAASNNVQATIAPFDQELKRLGAIAEPLIRRVAELQRLLPRAAEARRQRAEVAQEQRRRDEREARAQQARQERERQAQIVAGETTTPREQVRFPAKEERLKTLDRLLDRLSWKDPQTETALKQWVAKQDRLQGEFDARTQQLIEEQIQRIEAYEKHKQDFPNQKARQAANEKVIRNKSRELSKRLDWVGSKASGTTEARPAGTAVTRAPVASRQERQAAADRTLRETQGSPRTAEQNIQLAAAVSQIRAINRSQATQTDKDARVEAVFERYPELPLTPEQVMELAQYAPGRAIGPATKRQSAAPAQLRTSSPESLAGENRVSPQNPVTEARGVRQRNTPVGSSDMQAANKTAAEIQAAKTPEQKQAEATAAQKTVRQMRKLAGQRPKAPPSRVQKVFEEMPDMDADFDIDALFDNPDNEALFSATRDSTVYDERPTVRLNDDAMEAARDGRILDLLDNLAENASTPFARDLAKRLRLLVMRTKLRTIEGNIFDDAGNSVEGVFRPRTNTVELSDGALFEETVLHEIGHAVTVNQLDADFNSLSPEMQQARQELENLLNDVRRDPAFDKQYGRLNTKELVAEVLSNQDFRDRLDRMQPTLLRRIYNAMLRLFGMTPQSVSERAVENAYALFAPSKVSTGNVVASITRGVFPGSGLRFAAGVPESVRAFVSPTPAASTTGQKVSAFGLGFRTLALDRWAPVQELLKRGKDKGQLSETQYQQALIHMRLHEDTNRFTSTSLMDGVVQLQEENGKRYYGGVKSDANIRNVVAQVNEAGKALGNTTAAIETWGTWMRVLRAERLGLGYEMLGKNPAQRDQMTPAQINELRQKAKDIKDYVNNTPEVKAAFEKARETYKQYNRDLMKAMADAGTLPKDVAKQLADADYIPFYRIEGSNVVMDGIGSKPMNIGNLLDNPALRELVGSDKEMMPVLDSIVQNTSMITRMNIRNMQAKDTAYLLSKMGLGKVIKHDNPPANVIKFKKDGQNYWLDFDRDAFPEDVSPELVLQGMQGIKTTVPTMMRLFGYPTRWLRAGITRMPMYVVRQLIRDPLFAWMTTGTNFTPVVSSVRELAKIRKGVSPTEESLMRSGAISSFVQTGDYQDTARILRDLGTNPDKMGWTQLMMGLDNFAMQADASTRAVVYDAYRKQGMDHVDAMLGAAESMNFARRGTSASLYTISTLIPFFNAQLQGIDALYRAAKGDTVYEQKMDVRNKLVKRGLLMTAMTLAYAAAMGEDEAYKNATPQERALNWFVRLPGMEESFRIPIPFEPGLIFKSVPEAVFNVAMRDEDGKEAARAMAQQFLANVPGLELYGVIPGPQMPTAMRPLVEVAANYNFFTDSPLESMRDLGFDKSERFRPGTTEAAKALGRAGVLSPNQIEHLVRGYTGGMGILLMGMFNYPLRPLVSGDMPEGPARTLSQTPLFGTAFQPQDGRGAIDAAFQDIQRIERANRTFNKLVEEGRSAEARAYADRFAREIALASTGGAFTQQMGELARMRRAIIASDLSPAEKRERIQEIRQIEIQLARQVRSMRQGS